MVGSSIQQQTGTSHYARSDQNALFNRIGCGHSRQAVYRSSRAGPPWECHDHFRHLVHRRVGEGAEFPVNAIVHTQPRRERQVRYEPQFFCVLAFWDDAKAVDVAWGERYLGRCRKRAQHAAPGAFRVEIRLYDVWVVSSRLHVT